MSISDKYLLIYKYYEESNILETLIKSFNYFADVEMTKIVREIGEVSPRITQPGITEIRFKFERAWLGKADYVEKEGIARIIYPNEARIRNITYSGPVYVEFEVYEDKSSRGRYTVNIGRLPIMVKSKYCNTYGLSEEELIKVGEDPKDFGGYFIINGTERVLVLSEELSTNRFYVQLESLPLKARGFLLSESITAQYPHIIELTKDGILYLNFERYRKVPLILIIKALGLEKDAEIAKFINEEDDFEETYINLLEFSDVKSSRDALLRLATFLRLTGSDEIKIEKMKGILNTKLLPNVGIDQSYNILKAYNLCKMARKILLLVHGKIEEDVKDHFMNKIVRTPGELLRELFRVVIRTVINDALYQYDRLVRRGKIPSYVSIFRSKIFTERFESAMGTGVWTRERVGVSQALDRVNKLAVLSHLTRVWSSIEEEAELLEARMVHGTHWGRLDPIETPESKTTGLRKNLTLLSKISFEELDRDELVEALKRIGLKSVK
ncbi:MAG: DNA-directed RNA polymerase subunit B'' [Candidatus Aenigmatarchaeota archaeon]